MHPAANDSGHTALRLEIRGVVQGVGYRWSMVGQARRLRLRGWVRNRPDGSVEAVVAGPPEALERIVDWARQGPAAARVESVDVFAAEGEFDSFEQRPTG
jgi:acylphosphatase